MRAWAWIAVMLPIRGEVTVHPAEYFSHRGPSESRTAPNLDGVNLACGKVFSHSRSRPLGRFRFPGIALRTPKTTLWRKRCCGLTRERETRHALRIITVG